MNDTIAGASPVDQSVGRHVPGLIEAEMAEYWGGAYIDSSCAKDQLQTFATNVMAPLLVRINELTLYAAGVEAEREAALADAVRAYDKLVGVHASAKEHKERAKQLASELDTALDVTGLTPLSDETIARLMPEPTVCKANVVRWDRAAMHAFARAIEAEHGISL